MSVLWYVFLNYKEVLQRYYPADRQLVCHTVHMLARFTHFRLLDDSFKITDFISRLLYSVEPACYIYIDFLLRFVQVILFLITL